MTTPNQSRTRPKALVFAPFSPYPTQTGAHVGCSMVLAMVRRMGYDLVFASSDRLTDAPWSSERISVFAQAFGAIVEVHTASAVDPVWTGLQTLLEPAFSDLAWVTPSLALWFEGLVEKYKPELVLINYARWGRLADCEALKGVPRVLQTHDLLSVNKVFQGALNTHFRACPMDLEGIEEELLREDFFDEIERGEIPGLEEEIAVLKGFDLNILVSSQEVERIHRVDPTVAAHHMPMVFEPRAEGNTYQEPPLFLAHTNDFNFQGSAWFVQKVLPLILEAEPSFVMRLAGNICKVVKGLELMGFVEDLAGLYARTRYSICPLLGGTGQQVKVMEAMSYGLPVVVVPRIARATGILDGVNGLVAPDAPAFAEACLRLWRDPELTRRLGAQAREHMLTKHSFDQAYEAFARDLAAAMPAGARERLS